MDLCVEFIGENRWMTFCCTADLTHTTTSENVYKKNVYFRNNISRVVKFYLHFYETNKNNLKCYKTYWPEKLVCVTCMARKIYICVIYSRWECETGWGYLFKLTIISLIKLCCLRAQLSLESERRREMKWDNNNSTSSSGYGWEGSDVVLWDLDCKDGIFHTFIIRQQILRARTHSNTTMRKKIFLWSSICSFFFLFYFLHALHTFLPSNSCDPCDKTFSTLAGSEKVMKPNPLEKLDERRRKKSIILCGGIFMM